MDDMKWLNRVQLVGYLGKEPSVILLRSGDACATLSLATANGFSKEGTVRETTWHTVKIWGKDLSYLPNAFTTGSHVMVEGSLTYRSFCDTSGMIRTCAEIRAERLINLYR